MKTFLLLLATAVCAAAQVNVTTDRNDRFGTAANLAERTLTPSKISPATFGKLFSYTVQGSIFAQPLYISGLDIPGRGKHDTVFLATMDDQVYAFDAGAAGLPLWHRDLTNPAAGITPVPVVDVTRNNNLNIVGNVGILSTPVIDPATNTLYLVARTKEPTGYFQRIYALDTRTGTDRVAPVIIRARIKSFANDALEGYLHFNAKTGNQRPALALVNGMIVIAWASHEDIGPYHGWIMAYRARDLTQAAVFCVTPTGKEGGIWQSGRGPAVDEQGNIYFETGNGDWDGVHDFGESLLKLRVENGQFEIADFFTPSDYVALNKRDADFGSSGPFLVPGKAIVICGDKHGVLTLLDSNHLGKLDAGNAQVLQSLPVNGGRVLNGPAWWDGQNGPILYLWGEADSLKAFHFNGATLDPQPIAKSKAVSKGSPGGALSISANGNKSGSAVLWATLGIDKSADHGNAPGILRAFDAETLEEIWNSEQDAARDRLGTLVKFVPPVIANGKVYATTYDNRVNVYGLLN
jgi:outer membrane protein assembly factor BamB